jgi:hypothetical protein
VSNGFRLVFSSCFLLANMIYGNHFIDSLVKNLNLGLGCRHRIEYSSLMIIKEVEDISSDNRMTFRQLYYYLYFIFQPTYLNYYQITETYGRNKIGEPLINVNISS